MPGLDDVLRFGISKERKVSLRKSTPVSFQFMVSFLIGGVLPNFLDTQFQKVSGISSTIETEEIREGGENVYVHSLPKRVTHKNLILTRGMVLGSALNQDFNVAMTSLRFLPSTVLVLLLDGDGNPLTSWAFYRAYPVSWAISDLDATSENGVVIETMELAYARFQNVGL